MTEEIQRIAMFIDADNTQVGKIESAILEISKYGKILVKRAYGNWTKDTLKSWENIIRKLAIKQMQQPDYVKGKNATDMALTIDALDFLYNSDYDSFAIVSSDSDFTPLAIKLRESGKNVIGIGNKKTSEAFVSSCDNFIYLENLSVQNPVQKEPAKSKRKKAASGASAANNEGDSKVIADQKIKEEPVETEIETEIEPVYWELDNLIKIAYETYQNDDGYVNVGAAGSYIKRVKPDFDIKLYGAKKLTEYLKKYPSLYDVKEYHAGSKAIFEYKVKD